MGIDGKLGMGKFLTEGKLSHLDMPAIYNLQLVIFKD